MGRRSFVRLSAAGAAGLYVAGCGGEPIEQVQALVVGSGFGGSIAALRLAEAGVRVTVLERGKRWELRDDFDTFTTIDAPDGRCAWMHREPVIPGVPDVRLRNSPYVGLLQKLTGTNMNVVVPAAVGGGSLVYSGLMLQPPRALFESVFPTDVDYTEMDTVYYPRVRAIMQPGSMPDDVLASPTYASSRRFIRDAEAAGLDVERIAVAMNWDLVRAELDGSMPRQVVRGDYLYGLNSGAKHSIDRMGYLPMAEATGRVDVRPLHQVIEVGEDPAGGYRARVERIDERGAVQETLTIRADMLFLAAGSMNTTKLLLRARRDRTLPNLSDRVGESWGNNGQRIGVRGNLDETLGGEQGGPACIFVHDHDNPYGPVGMEYGPALLPFEHECLIGAIQSVPERLGRLVLDEDGEVTTDWDPAYDARSDMAFDHLMQRMIDAGGGQRVNLPGLDEKITFHPLGGATMGVVCDSYGRVSGHPGLYVVDSALIPGSTPAGNPFWTVAALAERCMDRIVAEDLAAMEGP
jgi:cholesterol oxidase